jgi:hypothetical protein
MEVTEQIKILRNKVIEWAKQNQNSGIFGNLPNRSCWNCNSAHEHLKKAEYPIECFDCGHIYYKGVDLTEQ